MIKSERTILSLLQKSDFDELLEMFSEKDAFKYIKPHQNKTKEERIDFLNLKLSQIENKSGYYWVIRHNKTQEFIGAINLTPIPETNKIQIGWMIKTNFQKQGYALETANSVLDFTIKQTNFNPIYGVFDKENIASERILQKLGFKYHNSLMEGNSEIIEYIYERQ